MGAAGLLACGFYLISPGLVSQALSAEVPAAGSTAAVNSGGDAGPYAVEPSPMTTAECGRCHVHHFRNLKENGGRHRFDCQGCHEVFHAFNPLRNNFAELMPQCANCHGMPHGEQQANCLGCHTNPHAPLIKPAMAVLVGQCASCHADPSNQLIQFPSAHREVGCSGCHHDRHGYIPQCFECHDPHFDAQAVQTCTGCHPVHKPTQISFAPDSQAETCKVCHEGAFNLWSKTVSLHGKVNCTQCHTSHGSIPDCLNCHKPPHEAQMLARFPDCLGCHLDPHDLPVKRGASR